MAGGAVWSSMGGVVWCGVLSCGVVVWGSRMGE